MRDDPASPAGSPDDSHRIGPLTIEGLRLGASADLMEIAGMTLDAVVPRFADAAVVFAAERLLVGSDPAGGSLDGRDGSGQVTVRKIASRFAADREDPAVFRPGEAVVFAAVSPYARCVRDGKPVIFSRPDSRTLEQAGPGSRAVFSRFAAFLAVPMNAGDTAAGVITLAREPGGAAFGDSDIADVTRLAAFAGAGVARAVALARHRGIADALQHGLLATEPARPEHVDVAARCLPARGHLVGGDWYDITALPGGRTAIVAGDVMGHGPEAAAIMAQLRAAAHVLAIQDLPPAEVLGHLNRLTATLPGLQLATCAYAVIDPEQKSCTFAAAGHLPPVLARPDGTTRILDLPSGQSLGIGPADYGQARIKLPPGTIIAFYTDGLVETRTRPFDRGITALQAELARAAGPLDATCDRLIRSLAHHPEDDITLILARIPPRPA